MQSSKERDTLRRPVVSDDERDPAYPQADAYAPHDAYGPDDAYPASPSQARAGEPYYPPQDGYPASRDDYGPDGDDVETVKLSSRQQTREWAAPRRAMPHWTTAAVVVALLLAVGAATSNLWLPYVRPGQAVNGTAQNTSAVTGQRTAAVNGTQAKPGIAFPTQAPAVPGPTGHAVAPGVQDKPRVQGRTTVGNVDWAGVAQQVMGSLVTVKASAGNVLGTGVVVGQTGEVLINAQLLGASGLGGPQVSVSGPDGATYAATVAGRDDATDLALLRTQKAGLTPLSLADSDAARIGDPVMSVSTSGSTRTFTVGVISSLATSATQAAATTGTSIFPAVQGAATGTGTPVITSDADQVPNSSGGPLIDAQGRMLGMSSARLGAIRFQASTPLTAAVPATTVRAVALQLATSGVARRAVLGVDATTSTVQLNGQTRSAAVVVGVQDGSPASAAGLRDGDAVLVFDGKKVQSSDALSNQLDAQQPGSSVAVSVLRDGQTLQARVTLAADAP